MAPWDTVSVSLIPVDFEEKGVYASYTPLVFFVYQRRCQRNLMYVNTEQGHYQDL